VKPDSSSSVAQMEGRLVLAVRHALQLAAPEESDLVIANRVLDVEGSWMRQLIRHVMIEYIRRKVRTLREGPPPANQLPIPGIRLPALITVPPGPREPSARGRRPKFDKIPLRDATLPDLLAHRKILVARLGAQKHKRLAELDKAIAIHRKFGKRSKKVTLGELVDKYGQQIFEFAQQGGLSE
jgi:hypothetical protein